MRNRVFFHGAIDPSTRHARLAILDLYTKCSTGLAGAEGMAGSDPVTGDATAMTTNQLLSPNKAGRGLGSGSATCRSLPLPLALPFSILEHIGRGTFYCVWYLAFYVLCMFRPFTGLMMLASIVMVPVSIVVYAHLDAARGMPFWSFGLMSIGLVACALAYTIFLDWFTPPGTADPFERYRKGR